jgi:hypothetical protein
MNYVKHFSNLALGNMESYRDDNLLDDIAHAGGALVRGTYRGVKTALQHPVLYPRVLTERAAKSNDVADAIAVIATPIIEQKVLPYLFAADLSGLLWIRLYQIGTTNENAQEIRIPLK